MHRTRDHRGEPCYCRELAKLVVAGVIARVSVVGEFDKDAFVPEELGEQIEFVPCIPLGVCPV